MSSERSQRPAWFVGLRAAAAVGFLALALALVAASLAQAGAADPAADAVLPVEMFYRHADLGDARLSPSGKRLAQLQQSVDQKLPGRINRLSCRACLTDEAVVLVLGGPWLRGGRWGWSPNAQFLASRGCVVI